METEHSADHRPDTDEVQADRKRGGWITFPFLTVATLGLLLATGGATSNIIVYLIKKFNVKSIDAAQINNIVNGCTSLAPVAGAIISDSFFGCFPVVAFSTFVTFLSLVLFTLTATVQSLRPTPCMAESISCEQPSATQLAVLYAAFGLLSVGMGGTRFTLMTMGADQFDKIKDQDVFFNWYFVIMYISSVVAATVIVYIQDNVSWGLGFGLCMVASAASVAVLMLGAKYYRRPNARGSPFTGLARVIVASIKKRKVTMRPEGLNYYHETVEGMQSLPKEPTSRFRFLNRAAIIADGDTNPDNSVAKPWSLCTVEQVEDLKALLRITPLWTTSIFLNITIGIQAGLSVLQALTMDRSLGPHFSVPPSSVIIFTLATVALILPVIDRIIIPSLHSLANFTPTPLQRLGLGHMLNTAAMVISALVERRRVSIVISHGASSDPAWTVPMSVMWLLLPLAATGLGEALHFPGQVAMYYQEFPRSLRSTATAMVALLVAIAFYGGTAVIGVVRRVTSWLPDNVNESRMENVFWLLAVGGAINFGYYLVCATMYKYQRRENETSTVGIKDVGENPTSNIPCENK